MANLRASRDLASRTREIHSSTHPPAFQRVSGATPVRVADAPWLLRRHGPCYPPATHSRSIRVRKNSERWGARLGTMYHGGRSEYTQDGCLLRDRLCSACDLTEICSDLWPTGRPIRSRSAPPRSARWTWAHLPAAPLSVPAAAPLVCPHRDPLQISGTKFRYRSARQIRCRSGCDGVRSARISES